MKSSNTPFVSVVVPVYNVENYIARCIESILQQTHSHLELILVDDGSPDKSGAICDEYAAKDPRIKVIHTDNHGVSHARNTGMDHANGEYLFFVDSDDWIEPAHIETLLPEGDEDLVYGGRKMHINGVYQNNVSLPDLLVHRQEWMTDYAGFINRGLTLFFVSPCYKMEIIKKHNPRFAEGIHCGEDGMFNITFLKYCQKIRYSNTHTYCYEDGDDTSNSLSHRFRPHSLQTNMVCTKAVEDLTGKEEYLVRWRNWHGILRHFRKWLTFQNGIHKRESKKAMKETFRNPYYRESIPYIRKHGSLDERIETYFMRYRLYPFYQPCYKLVASLSKIKQRFARH